MMKCCILSNPDLAVRHKPVHNIVNYLQQKGASVLLPDTLAGVIDNLNLKQEQIASETECVKRCDVVIAIGGDGTMLRSAKLVHDAAKPILGINSGRLGFLADTQIHEISEALDQLLLGKWETVNRFLLEAKSRGKSFYALNEFLFSKHADVSMITLEVYYGEYLINKYWADGLILATPTGSTAYNLSAGGPIIFPDTNVMVVTPVCPHALTTRSLVLPAEKKLRVKSVPDNQRILFSNDGSICQLDDNGLDVEIGKTDFHINLIKLPGRNYFETLRTKLMWGLDQRDRS